MTKFTNLKVFSVGVGLGVGVGVRVGVRVGFCFSCSCTGYTFPGHQAEVRCLLLQRLLVGNVTLFRGWNRQP
jgi:hypothetical protein